ncbi:hypothetical protein FRC07_003132 [Ceratobasidium sp. 392]|nr:hypothetical protein FRC07_003132 [Ceratobasidium sp. 392]
MSGVSNNKGVKVLDDLNKRGRNTAYRVLEGLAHSSDLIVVCGSDVSVAAGIQGSKVGNPNLKTTTTRKEIGSARATSHPTDTKCEFEVKTLAKSRIAARQAPLTPVIKFIHQKMDDGECSRCITRSFDGLELRDRPDLQDSIIMLHGDNRRLRCEAGSCGQVVDGAQVDGYDAMLLAGETVPCPACAARAASKGRTRGGVKHLRADVFLDGRVDPDFYRGKTEGELHAQAESSDALLIIGTYPNSQDVFGLLDELSQRTRGNEGVVVVIVCGADRDPTPWLHLADFILVLDPQVCAKTMIQIRNEGSSESAREVWEEFWTCADQTIVAIRDSWYREGWEFFARPITLQEVCDGVNNDFELYVLLLATLPLVSAKSNSAWEANSFKTIVLYITHGIANDHYQINDSLKATPQEFLDKTYAPIRSLVERSSMAVAFFLTCGEIYRHPKNVNMIQEWIDTKRSFLSVIGTLNLRMSPAYLADLLAQTAVSCLGFATWDSQHLVDCWLRDTLAATHTDLICFTRGEKPITLHFSPFEERPLGIPLPPLLNTCPCKPPRDSDVVGKKKVWKVSHTGSHRQALSEIIVIAECSLCEKPWYMRKPDLQGVLYMCGGLYASIMPYFYLTEDEKKKEKEKKEKEKEENERKKREKKEEKRAKGKNKGKGKGKETAEGGTLEV